MKDPLVSIVMPAYNAQEFIAESIDSILNQTYQNFEFIIIDDGSEDKTAKIIEGYKDQRIKFISRPNKGLSASCNEGIEISKGKYIARQDADDISEPHRLRKQVDFMERNPGIGLLGSNYTVIDKKSVPSITTDVFTAPDDLKLAEVFINQFGHGSVMLRKDVLPNPTYTNKYKISQDYDLWNRLSHEAMVANLKEPLYKWRSVEEGLSTNPDNRKRILTEIYEIRDREFEYLLKHRGQFNLLSFHPSSTRRGYKSYCELKLPIYRNMALMYCRKGLRRKAIPILFLAILLAPWIKNTYGFLYTVIFKKNKIDNLGYEFL